MTEHRGLRNIRVPALPLSTVGTKPLAPRSLSLTLCRAGVVRPHLAKLWKDGRRVRAEGAVCRGVGAPGWLRRVK